MFISSILAIAAISIKIPIFLLRAAGAIEDTADHQVPKPDPFNRHSAPGQFLTVLTNDEASLFREELAMLLTEEVAEMRAAKEAKEKQGPLKALSEKLGEWGTAAAGWPPRIVQ